MQVAIIDKKTGGIRWEYTVITNFNPEGEAWKCAVEDKLVEPDTRKDYEIRVLS